MREPTSPVFAGKKGTGPFFRRGKERKKGPVPFFPVTDFCRIRVNYTKQVFFYEKPIGDTPEGKFLFQILGAASEFEKAKILERTRRGRIYKAKRGSIVGNIAPYGYIYVKGKLT